MSAEIPPPSLSQDERPTKIRHLVVAVTTLMAILLYLDRLCVGIASEYIREDLRMTQTQMSWFLSAFFWSYALAQVPAGLFSDRFGARRMLTLYILAWSAFTGLLGQVHHVWQVLQLRLFCGVSQAGAYPTAGGLIRVWYPISSRGIANSIVALGGRAGGVLAPILTAWLISVFAATNDPGSFGESDIVDSQKLLQSFGITDNGPKMAVTERIAKAYGRNVQKSLADEFELERVRLFVLSQDQKMAGDGFNWRDWLPTISRTKQSTPLWYGRLVEQIGADLKQADLFDGVDLSGLNLAQEGRDIIHKREKTGSLTDKEATLLNRLIVEASFSGAIRRHRGTGWRWTLMVYGSVGIAVAMIFCIVGRDSPKRHPWCNDAERTLINDDATRSVTSAEPRDPPFPLKAMMTSLSLWGNSLMQIFTNIGWVFVVTWLPRYLDKVHGVPLTGQAAMTAIPTAAGIFGMYAGGWWTDRSTSLYGRKWGRRLPVVVTRFTAGAGYGICLLLSLYFTPSPSNEWLPWAYVAALCLMVFSVDMGNPAVWAYAQDVGGKYTGSVLGWANMWGNFGAALAPPLVYNRILGEEPTLAHWNMMFGICLLAFVLSGVCGLVMDSTKTLVHEAAE